MRWSPFLLMLMSAPLLAQETVVLRGRVFDHASGLTLADVTVIADARQALTDQDGAYRFPGMPQGRHRLSFRRLGYAGVDTALTISGTLPVDFDMNMTVAAVTMSELQVSAVSRQAERLIDAPGAVSVVDSLRVRELAPAGQVPLLLDEIPGVHAVQSGVYDFNLNARGFNSTLNTTMLVMVDGRDMATPILGNQDWADAALVTSDSRVELVRGPGSALYGANAFNGVLVIRTPAIRDATGVRLTLSGGQLNSARLTASWSALAPNRHWGWRLSSGYSRTDSWDAPRTQLDYIRHEYAGAGVDTNTIATPIPGFEVGPLSGQSKSTGPFVPGPSTGTPDPILGWFASARVDLYPRTGTTLITEAGLSAEENNVFTIGNGRSQAGHGRRPWARAELESGDVTLSGYYLGHYGRSVSLASASVVNDDEGMYHLEAQYHRRLLGQRGRLIAGGSLRWLQVDSHGTVLSAADDGRTDRFEALFGQFDYYVARPLKIVAAARLDWSTLAQQQFSPKLGVIYSPGRVIAFRLTYNRGFKTPSPLERFLSLPAGAPLDLTALETGLRNSPLGPALQNVPVGTLFTQSSAVPLLVLGNAKLQPQEVTDWGLGWTADVGRFFVTTDLFYDIIDHFTSGVLAGANPQYGAWTVPAAVPSSAAAAVEGAVQSAVPGLTRLADGSTAYVLSFGNEGRAEQWGAELGGGVRLTSRLRLEASYARNDYHLQQSTFLPGDTIVSNTAPNTATVSFTYGVADGALVHGALRFSDAYYFRSGSWVGPVPSSRSVDVSASVPLRHGLRAGIIGTNLLNERRYQLFGGSIVGRRLLATMTWATP